MARSAPHTPEDDIEATAQQPVQDENSPADSDRSSLSDVAESAPELSEDDELSERTYEQELYKFVITSKDDRLANSFIDFDNLSRVNILHLMNELLE